MSHLTPQQLLNEISENACVGFKLFTEEIAEHTPNASSILYCFVEGYDAPFYEHKVENITGEKCAMIPCGGKKGVILSHNFISTRTAYDSYQTLYFVDRDYTDNSQLGTDFFVTDGYAVENYYASRDLVSKFLRDIAQVTKDRLSEKDAALSAYDKWEQEWVNATKEFCGWYHCIIEKPDRKPNSDNYKKTFPKHYATIDHSGITRQNYTFQNLNTDYGVTNQVTEQEYQNAIDKIKNINDIRGKYVYQLINEFIEYLRIDSTHGKKGTILKKPFAFEYNYKTTLARLAYATETSPRLRSYILSRVGRNQLP